MLKLQQYCQGVLQQPARVPSRCVVAAAAKKQKPKKRKAKQPVSQRITYIEDEHEDDFDDTPANIKLLPGTRVPKAPAPKAAPASADVEPEDLYPVFPKQPKAVERLPDSKWSWGADKPAEQQDKPARLWNPKTGFMRTRAELQQEQGAAGVTGSSQQQQQQQQQSGAVQVPQSAASSSSSSSSSSSNSSRSASTTAITSSSGSSSGRVVERMQEVPNPLQAPKLPPSALTSSAAAAAAAAQAGPGDLPAVGRGQVLTNCALTAAAMSGAAVGLSILAAKQSAAVFETSQEAIDKLLQVPLGFQNLQQVGVMLGAAAAVTAARFVLKQQWPEFQEATDRSNKQVLTPLGWPDVVLVALLSGVSEELLFRWALVSGTWPDARGVLLSGAVFGVLHVSGGRNAAFAAWAAAVGWLYGAAFLVTGNVWVPAGAHAIANFASAAAWVSSNKNDAAAKQ